MTISLQRPVSDNLDLALAINRYILPLPNSGLADAERASQCRLASEMQNGVLFCHDAVSMACRTLQDKDTVPSSSYDLRMETITDRINQLIRESGLSPSEVARRVGVSKQTMGDWTSGRTVNIKPEHLIDFLDFFGVEMRWLVRGKGPKFAKSDSPPEVQHAADILGRLPPSQRAAFITVIEAAGKAA